jgi:hypothetical protein
MGRFTKRVMAGLAAALVMAVGASAQTFMFDNLEHGQNQNAMLGYWYFVVASGNELGQTPLETLTDAQYNAIITNARPGTEDGPMTFEAARVAGLTVGGTPPASINLGSYVAELTWNGLFDHVGVPGEGGDTGFERFAGVAVGSGLTADPTIPVGAGFANVTTISFDMWAPTDLRVIFGVRTIDNNDDNENPYKTIVTGTGAWRTYNVNIAGITAPIASGPIAAGNTNIHPNVSGNVCATGGGLAGDLCQEPWYGTHFTFNAARIAALVWQVNAYGDFGNDGFNTGTVLVDNVRFSPFSFTAPDVCVQCVGRPLPTPNTLISDFEDTGRENFLGYYWYFYTDEEAGGNSIVEDLVFDDYSGEDVMDIAGNGNNGTDGAFITFTMGSPFMQGEDNITPFVGIGTNLIETSDDGNPVSTDRADYFNASSLGGLYFDFRATGSVDFVTVEISDISDVTNAAMNGDDGQVFYIRIPVNNASWNNVMINFSEFMLPLWLNSSHRRWNTTLDLGALAKIQFKYTGTGSGSLAIDNVYFHGTQNNIRHAGNRSQAAAGLRASYNRGSVSVNWNAAQQISDGRISLVNTRGRVVASANIANVSGSRVMANLGRNLPTGMYFVRIDARDVNGRRIVQQAPISIVK